MITSIEIGNFLSHSNTKLEIDKGVTVFVGENGAGKSSVIDGITFALFGQHTRKSNKGLIKRGTNQGFAKVCFSINGKEFLAERKIDSKGNLSAQFSEKLNGNWLQIAAGERKQFGESMTKEIEKKIGLNFEKLKIASIVQQGELNSIIKAKPKEFKELLNAIIGIDKLDTASESMKIINKDFREKVREDIGYDDTHIGILKRDLEGFEIELKESLPIKDKLASKRNKIEEGLKKIQEKLDSERPKQEKLSQLESRRLELAEYAKAAIQDIRREISEKERKVNDCQGCFEYADRVFELQNEVSKINTQIKQIEQKIHILSNQKASLIEKQALAEKLKIKNDKCPVCDSNVKILNPLFQEEHLLIELKKTEGQIKELRKIQVQNNKLLTESNEKVKKSEEACAILKAHSIKSQEELAKIEREIKLKKENVEKVPFSISAGNLVEIAQLDSRTKMLFENIIQLEKETKGFDEKEFVNLKELFLDKQKEKSQTDQQLGAIKGKIEKAKERIEFLSKSIKELSIVSEYVERLNEITSNIYNRDGLVATSLRSWALNTISIKTSEFLSLLNTKIQRIVLSEKARDVGITCYSKSEVLELESLSGGEQVSIALALRLGMASLLGASNLNLIILDEPTTHLDVERRKSLVGVLSQLSNITNSSMPLQFIIISHDSEIFDDSTVENIFKFESTLEGSLVSLV